MAETALNIYQSYLDQMSAALLAHDADGFLRGIFLPNTLITDDDEIVISDRETAIRQFHGFANAIKAQGIDAYTRIAQSARFDGPDRIHGRHRSFMTARGKLVVPAFENAVTIERRAGVWGTTHTRHFTRFVSWPDILPRREKP